MNPNEVIEAVQVGKIRTAEELSLAIKSMNQRHPMHRLDALFGIALLGPGSKDIVRPVYANLRAEIFNLTTPVQEKVPVVADNPPPPHSGGEVGVDDYVKLEARNAEAEAFLKKWGPWWKVSSGYGKQAEKWMLDSIFQQKIRTAPKNAYERLIVGKAGDRHYNIVNVKKFPSETVRPIKD